MLVNNILKAAPKMRPLYIEEQTTLNMHISHPYSVYTSLQLVKVCITINIFYFCKKTDSSHKIENEWKAELKKWVQIIDQIQITTLE